MAPRSRRSIAARRFVVEVAVNSVTLGIIAAVATRIPITQPFPFGQASTPLLRLGPAPLLSLIALGCAIAAMTRVVRPVLEALTGRWLIATMGAFSVVIDTITLWLAGWAVQSLGIGYADPGFLWLSVIAAAFTVISWLARIALGLDEAIVEGNGIGSGLWRALDRLPTPRRNALLENLRLRQVYGAMSSTFLDISLEGTRIGALRTWSRRRLLGLPTLPADCPSPRRIRALLERLGPTYVKIGQLLASRGDMLPPELSAELGRLNAAASPFTWDTARITVATDLGRSPEAVFGSIDHEPFAAASTAQVHRATLPDGTAVVVKIQRPSVLASTKADLGVLEELATVAERRFAVARRIGAREIVAEFADSVVRELDYRIEAYNARRLARSMARYPEIHVPTTYPEWSGEHVLTEESIADGIALSRVDDLRAAGLDPADLGAVFVRAMVRQVLVDGFFHGDPHDGNVLAQTTSGQIVFLDMGQVGELDRQQRIELLGLIHALKAVDLEGIADSLLALSHPTAAFDERRFRGEIDRIGHAYLVYGEAGSLGEALATMISTLTAAGLRLDGRLTMAIKAISQAEATARMLAPDVDLAAIAITEATAAVRESFTPEQIRRRAGLTAAHIGKGLARRLPTLESGAYRWLDMLGRGKFTVELETPQLERSFAGAGRVGRQATVGIIVAGQLVGTAIVLSALLQPTLGAFQLLGFVAMAAFALALLVSLVALRRVLAGSS